MIADREAVRHEAVDHVEAFAGHLPLVRVVHIDDVTHVRHEDDVLSAETLADPAGMVPEDRIGDGISAVRCRLGAAPAVALGVRDHHDGEGARRRGVQSGAAGSKDKQAAAGEEEAEVWAGHGAGAGRMTGAKRVQNSRVTPKLNERS